MVTAVSVGWEGIIGQNVNPASERRSGQTVAGKLEARGLATAGDALTLTGPYPWPVVAENEAVV